MLTARRATAGVALLCALTLGLTAALVSPAQAVEPSQPATVACTYTTGRFEVRPHIQADANFQGAEQYIAYIFRIWHYTNSGWVDEGWGNWTVQLISTDPGTFTVFPAVTYNGQPRSYYYVMTAYAWYSPTYGWYGGGQGGAFTVRPTASYSEYYLGALFNEWGACLV